MSLEMNKLAAAVLVAGLSAMVVGKVTDVLYHPQPAKERGYSIDVPEVAATGAPAVEEGPALIAEYTANASVERGQALAKACVACHSFEKGGANKVGPNLYAIIGSHYGHMADYAYSKALLERKDEIWEVQSMSEFLTKPQKYLPGTKMGFAGIKKPEDRADVIAYLNSLSDNPKPLPVAEAKTEAAADSTTTEVPKE